MDVNRAQKNCERKLHFTVGLSALSSVFSCIVGDLSLGSALW